MFCANDSDDRHIDPPDPNRLNDPKHWRERADEARAMAELVSDGEAREKMLGVAGTYDRLAKDAEARLRAM